jgi:hypothetical protein
MKYNMGRQNDFNVTRLRLHQVRQVLCGHTHTTTTVVGGGLTVYTVGGTG